MYAYILHEKRILEKLTLQYRNNTGFSPFKI